MAGIIGDAPRIVPVATGGVPAAAIDPPTNETAPAAPSAPASAPLPELPPSPIVLAAPAGLKGDARALEEATARLNAAQKHLASQAPDSPEAKQATAMVAAYKDEVETLTKRVDEALIPLVLAHKDESAFRAMLDDKAKIPQLKTELGKVLKEVGEWEKVSKTQGRSEDRLKRTAIGAVVGAAANKSANGRKPETAKDINLGNVGSLFKKPNESALRGQGSAAVGGALREGVEAKQVTKAIEAFNKVAGPNDQITSDLEFAPDQARKLNVNLDARAVTLDTSINNRLFPLRAELAR